MRSSCSGRALGPSALWRRRGHLMRGIYRNVFSLFAAIELGSGPALSQDLPKTLECETRTGIVTFFDDNRAAVRSPSVESVDTIDFVSYTTAILHSRSIGQDGAKQSGVANYRVLIANSFYEFQPIGPSSPSVTGGLISVDRRTGQFQCNFTLRLPDSTAVFTESGMCRQLTSVNRF